MSVESLMVHEVTLLTQTGISTEESESGEGIRVFDEGTPTTMYLEPKSGEEEAAARNTPIGDWLGIGRADIDWDSTQRVLYGAHTFDIIAPPRYIPNPRLDTISHVELDLQEVDTVESVDAIATPEVVGGVGGV